MKIGSLEVYGIIYKITNVINGKVYIGQTTNERGFNGRYSSNGKGIERVYNYSIQKSKNDDRCRYNIHLYKSICKYGFDCFKVDEIFDIAFSSLELDVKEKAYISLYKSSDVSHGYNKTEGGQEGLLSLDERRNNSNNVICINDGNLFSSAYDASLNYDVNVEQIRRSCRCHGGVRVGFDEKFVFMYEYEYNKLSKSDIECILSNANELNKGKNHHNSKRVICLNTLEVYDTIEIASALTGIRNSNISGCCFGKQNRVKDLKGNWVVFLYYDDYIQMTKSEIEYALYKSTDQYKKELLSNSHIGKASYNRMVKCINTGEVFESIKDAMEKYNASGLYLCLRGRTNSSGRHPVTHEKLKWEYV